jgi:hypothetical protein
MERLGTTHYVPVLLTKKGELDALEDVIPSVGNAVVPLLAVHPIDDDADGNPRRSLDDHLGKIAQRLTQVLSGHEAFVDLLMVDGVRMSGETEPLQWLTSACADAGVGLIPTVSPDRSAGYVEAVKSTLKSSGGREVCVRLSPQSWPTTVGMEPIDALLEYLELRPAQAHLVFDLQDQAGPLAVGAVANELRALPQLENWRSVVTTSTSMPKSMPSGKGIHPLVRVEWETYEGLHALALPLLRVPTFGDYAISHPDPSLELNPAFISIAGTVRYTTIRQWLIAKGDLYKAARGAGLGAAALIPAAAALRDHEGFMSGHCEVERWVEDVAAGLVGAGSPTTWRQQGTAHHLRLVTEQLANLAGA